MSGRNRYLNSPAGRDHMKANVENVRLVDEIDTLRAQLAEAVGLLRDADKRFQQLVRASCSCTLDASGDCSISLAVDADRVVARRVSAFLASFDGAKRITIDESEADLCRRIAASDDGKAGAR